MYAQTSLCGAGRAGAREASGARRRARPTRELGVWNFRGFDSGGFLIFQGVESLGPSGISQKSRLTKICLRDLCFCSR